MSTEPDTSRAEWLADVIRARHSARSYLPRPVPDHIIRSVFDTARWAPSNSNSQPWHVAVVSGAARDALEKRLLALVDAGQPPAPAFPPSAAGFGPEHQARSQRNGAAMGALMGVSADDGAGRARLMRRNWAFYGAPHVAFYSLPRTMGVANGVDLGLLIQTVMLQLTAHGIASSPQGSLAAHPGPIHEIAEIPEDHGIVCGMSFGYADPEAPINQHRTDREPLEEVVSFHS